jgi:hypothetical protein
VYRIDELSKGYTGGKLIHNQGMFIALEGVWVCHFPAYMLCAFMFRIWLTILNCRMVLVAVFALNIAHPGLVFAGRRKKAIEIRKLRRHNEFSTV